MVQDRADGRGLREIAADIDLSVDRTDTEDGLGPVAERRVGGILHVGGLGQITADLHTAFVGGERVSAAAIAENNNGFKRVPFISIILKYYYQSYVVNAG